MDITSKKLKFFNVFLSWAILFSCGKKIEDRDLTPSSASAQIETSTQEGNETVSQKNNDLQEALFNAISNNDTNLVKSSLKEDPQVDYLFENGETPLTLAIKKAKNEIISLIIKNSQDIDLKNRDGKTAIHLAVSQRKFLAFSNLIGKNAKIDLHDNDNLTPLHYALITQVERFILTLLTYGADFKMKNTKENTKNSYSLIDKLQELDFKKSIELIRLIENHDNMESDRFISAVSLGNTNFVNYLLVNFSQYKEFIKETNIINIAIDIEDPQLRYSMVDMLLNWGANPNINSTTPPLIYAAKRNEIKIIESLIIYGADIFIQDENELNVLDWSVSLLNDSIIKLIFSPLKNTNDEKYRLKIDKVFDNACKMLPDNDDRFELTLSDFLLIKRRIKSFLRC